MKIIHLWRSYLSFNINSRCKMMIESERISIFQWHYQMNQKAFYMFYIFFYNTLYTIPKNSRKNMFDSD